LFKITCSCVLPCGELYSFYLHIVNKPRGEVLLATVSKSESMTIS